MLFFYIFISKQCVITKHGAFQKTPQSRNTEKTNKQTKKKKKKKKKNQSKYAIIPPVCVTKIRKKKLLRNEEAGKYICSIWKKLVISASSNAKDKVKITPLFVIVVKYELLDWESQNQVLRCQMNTFELTDVQKGNTDQPWLHKTNQYLIIIIIKKYIQEDKPLYYGLNLCYLYVDWISDRGDKPKLLKKKKKK